MPSGPGAWRGSMVKSASRISSKLTSLVSMSLSSSYMTEFIMLRSATLRIGFQELKRFLKDLKINFFTCSLPSTHSLSLFLILLISIGLLLVAVERWKNRAFFPSHLIFISLDLSLQSFSSKSRSFQRSLCKSIFDDIKGCILLTYCHNFSSFLDSPVILPKDILF